LREAAFRGVGLWEFPRQTHSNMRLTLRFRKSQLGITFAGFTRRTARDGGFLAGKRPDFVEADLPRELTMQNDREYAPETLTVHAGIVDQQFHPVIPPIYQVSTFAFENAEHGAALFAGEGGQGLYLLSHGQPDSRGG
jgi:hypothetical protein